ncbi:AIPR family protein [Candidatus Desantisbacteria bacterium]|nr:AIPR family protein [Candidatus Desantisbacteria bacterium]
MYENGSINKKIRQTASSENEALIDKITEGTNSQNPIFERDLKANHEVQLMV